MFRIKVAELVEIHICVVPVPHILYDYLFEKVSNSLILLLFKVRVISDQGNSRLTL